MKTIWKFLIDPEADAQTLMLPEGATILCVNNVDGHCAVHISLEPDYPSKARVIYCYATGEPINRPNLRYIGTVVYRNGVHIYHYFEDRQP